MEFIKYNKYEHKLVIQKNISHNKNGSGSYYDKYGGTDFDKIINDKFIYIYLENISTSGFIITIEIYINDIKYIFELNPASFIKIYKNTEVIFNQSKASLWSYNTNSDFKIFIDKNNNSITFFSNKLNYTGKIDIIGQVDNIRTFIKSTLYSSGETMIYSLSIFGLLPFNLIKEDDILYNISNNNYDINRKVYNPLTIVENQIIYDFYKNNKFIINDLFVEKQINGETFKPVDKFNNFKISKLI